MRHSQRLSLVLLATVGLPVALALAAADAKLVATCDDCHGANGVTGSQQIPTLAGVSAPVQSDSLRAYRARTRACPKYSERRGNKLHEGDMCSAARDLADAAIADLAAHYAQQAYVATRQDVDAAKSAAGRALHDRHCEKCHSGGGRNAAEDAGILAGQPLGWLKFCLAAFKRGESAQPKKMKDALARLSEADLEALAHYYAGGQ